MIGPLVGLQATDDVAGLPLMLLAVGTWAVKCLPLVNGVSRRDERRADRYALLLTQDTDAFVSAMRRLEAQNLAERCPSAWVRWLWCSHPPVDERIAAAEAQRASTISSPCISLHRSSSARLQ